MHNSRFSPLQMLMFVLAFGLIGAYILIKSFAAPVPKAATMKTPAPDARARALMASQQLVAGAPVLKDSTTKHDTAKHSKVKGDLTSVTTERTKDMLELMKTDPKSARLAILPQDKIDTLTSEGVATEQRVTVNGKLAYQQVDDPKLGDQLYTQVITTDNKKYTLDTEQSIPSIKAGSSVQVSGYVVNDSANNKNGVDLGNQFLVDAAPTVNTYYAKDSTVTAPVTVTNKVLGASTASASDSSDGNINVAFLIGNIPGGRDNNFQPGNITASEIQSMVEGKPSHDVKSYIAENSYGKATLIPSYFGAYDLSSLTCDQTDAIIDALKQAANSSINFSQYQVLAYMTNCGFRGSASSGPTPTPQGTIAASSIALSPSITVADITHELAHAMNSYSGHGSFFDCSPQTFVAPTAFGSDSDCTAYEYSDPEQVLGAMTFVGDLSPNHKEQKGWLTAGTSQYPLVTSSGTYTLTPYENGSGILALKIPRGDGTFFTVEYRQPIGFDSWMNNSATTPDGQRPCINLKTITGFNGTCNLTQGASIRYIGAIRAVGPGGGADDTLLDNTPGTIGTQGSDRQAGWDSSDGALLPGKTFTDSATGMQIRAVSANSSGLTLNVTIPATANCVRLKPSVSAPSPSTQTGAPGVTKTYGFTLTNNDSATCKPNQFQIHSGTLGSGSYSGTSIATPDFLTLAPGASATVSVAVTPSTLVTDNSYQLSTPQAFPSLAAVFTNTLDTDSADVAGVTYVVSTPADTTKPSTPTNFKATALGSRAVKLSWTASSDNLGVAGYNIYDSVNGVGCPTVPAGVSSCVVTQLYPSTTYNFSITAFDHKDNQSGSATASVTTPATTSQVIYPTKPDAWFSATDHSITSSWSPGYTNSPLGIAYYSGGFSNYFRDLPADTLSSTYYGLTSQSKSTVYITNYDGDGHWTEGGGIPYTAVEGSSSPSQPKGLYVSAANSAGTTLNWTASTDARGIAYYKIFRDTRYIGQSNTNSYTDTTAPGQDAYSVQAVNIDGSLSQPSVILGALLTAGTMNPSANSSPPTTPPIATITSPTNGSTLTGTVSLSASVANVASCTSVTYYIDGEYVGSSSTAPYPLNLDTTNTYGLGGNGPHTVVAEASNNQYVGCTTGPGMGSTGPIDVLFNNSGADLSPPTVSITNPTNGSTVTGTVTISANATDNKAVDHVTFSVDGNILSNVSTAPYAYSWNSSSVPNGSHTITATAYDTSGNTAVSTVSVTTANVDTVKPTAPSNLTGSAVSQTAINLSWGASTDNLGVAGYYIIRNGVTIAQTSGTATTYSDSGLSPTTNYSYQVEAYDAANNTSDPSNTASVTTQSPAPDTSAPTAPTGLVAGVVSATQVNLSWKASTDNVSVDHYDIYRSNTKIYSVPAADATDSSGNVSFADLTLRAGTSYSYWLYAYDKAGNKSATSNKVSATTPKLVTGYASITGRLTNTSGSPVSSAKVAYSNNGRTTSSSSNSNGNYVLSSIPASTPLTFTYSLAGYLTQTLPLSLTPDQNTVQDMSLHKLGTINGTITNSSTNAALSNVVVSYQLNGATKTTKTSRTGTYTITALPAGSYSLTYSLSGYTTQTQTVNIDNDQTLTQNVSLTHL